MLIVVGLVMEVSSGDVAPLKDGEALRNIGMLLLMLGVFFGMIEDQGKPPGGFHHQGPLGEGGV